MAWQSSTRSRRLPPNWRTIRTRILRRDQHTCRLRLPGCTELATQVDHIQPGDDHSPDNLRASCAHCNARANIATRPKPASRKRPTEPHPGLLT